MGTVTIDSKGRVMIPKKVRDELNVQPGDALFLRREGNTLQLAKAENPFDGLANHAEREYRAGRTRSLRDIAVAEGVTMDDG